jgi:hypothetical protein
MCFRLKLVKARFAVTPGLLSILTLSLVAQQSVSPVPFSETKDVVLAFSSSGAITLPAVHLQLDLTYPSGKKERSDLSVVHNPRNGRYLWRVAEGTAPAYTDHFLEALKSHKIYEDADGLFDFVSRGYLWVKVYTLRADSLEAAKRAAIKEIEHGIPSIERGYVPSPTGPSDPWPWDSVHVSLPISSEFICGSPARADCPSPSLDTIVSISKEGRNWRLVLRNHWNQEVVLDSEFKLLSTQRLGPPQ